MIASLESAGVEVVFVEALTEQRGELDPRLRLQDGSLWMRDAERWVALLAGVPADADIDADERFAVVSHFDDRGDRLVRVLDLLAPSEVALPAWGAPAEVAVVAARTVIAIVGEALIAWDPIERGERWRRPIGRSAMIESIADRVVLHEPDRRTTRLLDARAGVELLQLSDVRWWCGAVGGLLLLQRRARGLDVIDARDGRPLGTLVSSARSLTALGAVGDRLLLLCDEELQLAQLRPFVVLAGARVESGALGPTNIVLAGPSRVEIEDRTRERTLAPLDPERAVEWLPFDDRAERPARALVSIEDIDALPAPPSRDPARVAAILAVVAEEGPRLSAVFERCVAQGLVEPAFDPRAHEPLSRMGGGMFRWKDGADDILRAFATLLCDAASITAARALLREAHHRALALGEPRRAEIEWRFAETSAREPWLLRPLPCEHLLLDALPTALTEQDARSSHGRARLLEALWQHAVAADVRFAPSSPRAIRGRPLREFASPYAPLVALESLGYSLWCCAPRQVVTVPLIEPWKTEILQST